MTNINGKVLIVYYSFSGVTKGIAEKLQKLTCGDLFEIQTVKTYPSYDACVEEAKRELESGNLPDLKGTPPDISAYSLILVGGPVWWYTVATPVMNFLKKADFAGKKTAMFCTHAGGVGKTLPHFKEQVKNASVFAGIDFYNPQGKNELDLQKKLTDWLDNLC